MWGFLGLSTHEKTNKQVKYNANFMNNIHSPTEGPLEDQVCSGHPLGQRTAHKDARRPGVFISLAANK